nr:methylated-DNA--[protein]-cysteine S-methyltransferase [Ktedonobacterales bacterium]
ITIDDGGSAVARGHLAEALHQLAEYFAGERRVFTLALAMQGPTFHQAAWEAVARVPYGETRSYLDIAQALGDAQATRAVGMANGANPLAPVVPCHRIVGSDGRLTGYGPGMPLKRRLLAMEGAMPASTSDIDYAAWLAVLPPSALLGVRATKALCRPTCDRARRYADRCPRIFYDVADGVAAGFQPCAMCQPATPHLVGLL